MAAGSGVIMGHERVEKISESLRDYFAPGAEESAYQEVARCLRFARGILDDG